jgi:Mg/Co/Ni transporter MgtE
LASNIGMFGEGLQALMWGLVASYGLICVLQLTFLKIDDFSWWRVLFEREFLTGIICAMFLSAYAVFRIEQADFSAWLSLLLAVFVSLLSLTVLSLFNDKLRTDLKLRLSIK